MSGLFGQAADMAVVEIILIVITACMTFLFGRYTSHLEDRRRGIREIDNTFYKPFLSLYKNAHHAYALFFVDIDYSVQEEIMKLLLDNVEIVPPKLRLTIYNLDQCFSGYSQDIEQGVEILQEEKEHVEKYFLAIYHYIERQYIKNERKLYCSLGRRMCFMIQEFLINHMH